jgi:hypothetical protein
MFRILAHPTGANSSHYFCWCGGLWCRFRELARYYERVGKLEEDKGSGSTSATPRGILIGHGREDTGPVAL